MQFPSAKEYTKKSGIYIITNSVNSRVYVGSAKDIRDRYRRHVWDLRKGSHCNDRLINFINKHGIDSLAFSVLEICPDDKLIEREQYWLNFYDSYKAGFNMVPNAGNTLGYKHSPEVIEKVANQIRGRKQSKEVIERRVASIKERYKHTPKYSPVKIALHDEAGAVVTIFRSLKECADYFGVDRGSVKRWIVYYPHLADERRIKVIEGAETLITGSNRIAVCKSCGKEFNTLSRSQKFCSRECIEIPKEFRERSKGFIKENVKCRTVDSFKRIGAARTKHQYKIQLMDGSGKLIKVYDSPFDCSTDFLENFMGIPYMENKKRHLRFRKRFCRVFTQDKHIEGYIFRMAS